MTEPQRSSWFIEWIKSALLEVQEYFRLCAAAIRGAFSRPFYAHDVMEQIDIIGLAGWREVLPEGSGGHFVVMSFAARWAANEPLLNEEHDDFQWTDPDALDAFETTTGLPEIVAAARQVISAV